MCKSFYFIFLSRSVSHSVVPDSLRPRGSSVHGILQAKILSGLPFPSPGSLPDLGVEPESPTLQANSLLWAIREVKLLLKFISVELLLNPWGHCILTAKFTWVPFWSTFYYGKFQMYKKVEGIAQWSLCSHYPASVIVFESLFKDLILKFSVCFLKMETSGFSLNVSSNQGWKSKPPTITLPLVPKADNQRERTSPSMLGVGSVFALENSKCVGGKEGDNLWRRVLGARLPWAPVWHQTLSPLLPGKHRRHTLAGVWKPRKELHIWLPVLPVKCVTLTLHLPQ